MDFDGYLEAGGGRGRTANHSGWRGMTADGSGVLAPLKKIRGLDAAVLQAWRLGCCSSPGLEAWRLGGLA